MDRPNNPRKSDYVTINPEFNEVGTFNTFDRRLADMDTSLSKVIMNSLRRKNDLANSMRRNSEAECHHNKNERRVEFPQPIQKNYHNLQSPHPPPVSSTDTRWLSAQCEETHSPSYGRSPTASIRYREELHEAKYHSPPLQRRPQHSTHDTNTNIPTTPQNTQNSPLKEFNTTHLYHTPQRNPPHIGPSPPRIPLQPIPAQVSQTAQSTAPPEGFMLPLTYNEYISVLAQRHQQSAGIVSKPHKEVDARSLLTTSTVGKANSNNPAKRRPKVNQQITNTYETPPVEYPSPADPWERGYRH
eukprot:TRINITY_DN2228_c0_g1_i1.p1 TRINITY_DN2228_c0_g1~~TRINITY_DN2228_c0_g1_i1.p1  ORF type:complete len:300 (+),score=62.34 TRINITY_DN2228_c0_g1_i1:188-1087(+)